jgi:DNA-binding MarR family transcriptional regulator
MREMRDNEQQAAELRQVLGRLRSIGTKHNPTEVAARIPANEKVVERRTPEQQLAADMILFYERRDRVFGTHALLFKDPAWRILLDLFVAGTERRISVSSACIASGIAATTALRHLERLYGAGLVFREPDPYDNRRSFVRLAEAGRELMLRSLSATPLDREDGRTSPGDR